MIILGIDPGTATTGWGVVEKSDGQLYPVGYGCIKTAKDLTTAERLRNIHREFNQILKKYKPQRIAVEDIFFFKNLTTAVKVSQARGVIMACAGCADMPVSEYTPLQVKQAATSYGRAQKRQVQKMVKLILGLKEIPKPDDAADALAVAICCAHSIINQ